MIGVAENIGVFIFHNKELRRIRAEKGPLFKRLFGVGARQVLVLAKQNAKFSPFLGLKRPFLGMKLWF